MESLAELNRSKRYFPHFPSRQSAGPQFLGLDNPRSSTHRSCFGLDKAFVNISAGMSADATCSKFMAPDWTISRSVDEHLCALFVHEKQDLWLVSEH